MTTTFASRLTADGGRNLRLYVTVQGIPFLFQDARETVPAAVQSDVGQRTVIKTITSIQPSAKKLDLVKGRMVGGSLTVRMVDDADGVLRALFAPRARRRSYLASPLSLAEITALVVTDNTRFTEDPVTGIGTVYVGGETITWAGATGADTLDIASRAAFGSRAKQGFGAATGGTAVYDVPPSWVGRRVSLVGYFLDTTGGSTADLSRVLDTYRLEESPAFVDGHWEFRCSHLSDEYASTPMGIGLDEIPAGISDIEVSGELITFSAPITPFTQGSQATSVIVTGSTTTADVVEILPGVVTAFTSDSAAVSIHDIDNTSVSVICDRPSRAYPRNVVTRPETIRQVAILDQGSIGAQCLMALTSRVGDASNGDYDTLGGVEASSQGGYEMQIGAGIDVNDVDIFAFADETDSVGTMAGVAQIVDVETTVEDFLSDFCFVTQSFWFVTRTGLLSVSRLAQDVGAVVMTIDDDVIIGEPSVSYAEDQISPKVRLLCNYNPITGEYATTLNMIDTELRDRYPTRGDVLEIKSKIIAASPAERGPHFARPLMPISAVETLVRRRQVANGRGRVTVSMRCTLDVVTLDLGDIVTVTKSIPDFAGSTVNQSARVMSIDPNYDGAYVDLVVELVETARLISPAVRINSELGGTLFLEAGAGAYEPWDGTIPGREFPVNWPVAIHSVSTGSTESVGVIITSTDTALETSVLPSFAINQGDILFLDLQAACDGVVDLNVNGLAITAFIWQMPDDEGTLDAGIGEYETRWS